MAEATQYISPVLVKAILAQYELPSWGIHGVTHWARVLENGRRLALTTGANLKVVELFCIFHDSRRTNEGWDFAHGHAGAKLALSWCGTHYEATDDELELLVKACEGHTFGTIHGDVTMRTCWDADRLDLGRVGITPIPRKLCTAAARDVEIIAWAEARSRARVIPELISSEWGLVAAHGSSLPHDGES